MNTSRHQVVHSLSLSVLQRQITERLREGWVTVGSPTLAQPADRSCPACWVQALYLHSRTDADSPLRNSPAEASRTQLA